MDLVASMYRCPAYAPVFGALGCCSAITLTVIGASYGTAKSAPAIFASGVLRPDRLMQNTLCAVMAQILAIYGLVASVLIAGDLREKTTLFAAFLQLGAGLAVGLSGMAAGFSIGIVGDAGGAFSSPLPLPSSTSLSSWPPRPPLHPQE
ncbi:hypothetical protein ACHAO5_008605 [Verticillium nonalfalfae]